MVSRDNACAFLGITVPSLNTIVKQGRLTAYKVGNAQSSKVFFKEQDLRDFVKKNTVGNCTFRGEWMTEREVCRILKIGVPKLMEYVKLGKVSYFKYGVEKGARKLYRSTEINKLKGELK